MFKMSILNNSNRATTGTNSSRNFRILRKCRKIFASSNHSFAITDSEEVYAWGDNSLGVLGLPDFKGKNVLLPKKIGFNDILTISQNYSLFYRSSADN